MSACTASGNSTDPSVRNAEHDLIGRIGKITYDNFRAEVGISMILLFTGKQWTLKELLQKNQNMFFTKNLATIPIFELDGE